MKHSPIIVFSTLLAAMVLSAACSNQGEGGRCDQNNKNDDCGSGLTCQKIQGQETAICCPPPSKPTSVSACIPGQVVQTDSGTRDATPNPPDEDASNHDASDEQDAALDGAPVEDGPDPLLPEADATMAE